MKQIIKLIAQIIFEYEHTVPVSAGEIIGRLKSIVENYNQLVDESEQVRY